MLKFLPLLLALFLPALASATKYGGYCTDEERAIGLNVSNTGNVPPVSGPSCHD